METKTCKRCGRELPIENYQTARYGRMGVCRECVAIAKTEAHKDRRDSLIRTCNLKVEEARTLRLSQFTPRELMEELHRRGYEGQLKYTHRHYRYNQIVTMAQLIRYDSKAPEVLKPQQGDMFDLLSLKKYVGGFIEIVRLADNRYMIVNEEGKLYNLPYNMLATQILSDVGVRVWGKIVKGDDAVRSMGCIVGDVVICEEGEF